MRHTVYTRSVFLITLVLFVMACTPTEERKKVKIGDTNNTSHTNNTNHANSTNNSQGDPLHQDGEDDTMHTMVGALNGSWRVATDNSDDTPVVYLDFVHEMGKLIATGDYLMSIGVYEQLDGQTGELKSVSFSSPMLTVSFNPTNDELELYTLNATLTDKDTFSGTLKNSNGALNMAVNMTRRVVNAGDGMEGVMP